MSKSRLLGVKDTLHLLGNLQEALKDCAARETKLENEYRARSGAELRRHEAALAELDSEQATRLNQADEQANAEKARLQQAFERRQAGIARALKASQKNAGARIDEKEGRKKYELQRRQLDSGKKREADLAANDAALAEFQRALGENRAAFEALEQEAARAFAGFSSLGMLLATAEGPAANGNSDEHQLLEELNRRHAKTAGDLAQFRKQFLPGLFRALPLWLMLGGAAAACGGLVPLLNYFKANSANLGFGHAGAIFAVLSAIAIALYLAGKKQAAPLALPIAQALDRARRDYNACLEKSAARHEQERQRIEAEFAETNRQINEQWNLAIEEATSQRNTWPANLQDQSHRASATNERLLQARRERVAAGHRQATERLRQEFDARRAELVRGHQERLGKFTAEHDNLLAKLEADWKTHVQTLYEPLQVSQAEALREFPAWRPELWAKWQPPQHFVQSVPVGHLEVEAGRLSDPLPQNARLTFPGPANFTVPLLLNFPQAGSLLLETSKGGSEEVTGVLNNLMLRILAKSPAGKASFTIIDPVKLGENFAGIMHLADYEEGLINSRIWTQTTQIEQKLADLNEHMEKVIQMYLRNEYETIAEYNEQAGNIAEKYHFLVVADFPANFSETAVKRLLNIVSSGARCGVFALIHWDRRHPAPPGLVVDELRKRCVDIACAGPQAHIGDTLLRGTRLKLEAPPEPELASSLLHQIGQGSKDSNRVMVPFEHVAPPAAEVWSGDTTEELVVPIGRTGATKLQYLAIGKGTRQHALLAGKTGSGKSTLFHVMITNLATWFGPDMVEFYLVDFKKGVEFKCYGTNRLPHARVVAIESDREFGLSVLQRLDGELKRRGDLFRALGVQDIAGYKKTGGAEPMPRCLLLIDEFQEFFVEDDQISQNANVLLDRIVRQGRAFGIHVILGSQTLGGAYTLARATMGQMVIRIALQCNEADAYLIMDESNPAPRLLTRPGEGIYNDSAGALEGNSPFQTVWLSDDVREGYLRQARARADRLPVKYPGPIVFEGNAPADVRDNPLLQDLLAAPAATPPAAGRIWLGAPNSIKGPTEASFHRQSGNHLLIVGQREEAALAMLAVGMIALAAQYPPESVRLVLIESTTPESPQRAFLSRVIRSIPHPITVARNAELADTMNALAAEQKQRAESDRADEAPATFIFIHDLQNYKKLRKEDDFSFSSDASGPNPANQLGNLISEGAPLGLHLIATCDTYNNVNRFLGRKALSEFEMRVLFQMSANDSASLIDNPKAGTLGLHRALFYNEHEGYLEVFRPYAQPGHEWLDQAAALLKKR